MIHPLLTRAIPKAEPGKPKNDPQRSCVYMLERELAGCSVYHAARRDDLLGVLEHACRYYKIAPPVLRIYRDNKSKEFGFHAYTLGEPPRRASINLNAAYHGANLFTLLHELAHHIVDFTWSEQNGKHTPEFVGVFMHLLHKYKIMPEDAFRVVAARKKIQIADKYLPSEIRGLTRAESCS
jgi:hypothetical protein